MDGLEAGWRLRTGWAEHGYGWARRGWAEDEMGWRMDGLREGMG